MIPHRPKIAIVLTRDLSKGFGLTGLLRKMLETLEPDNDLVMFRLGNLLETRSVPDFLAVAMIWAWSLLLLRPLPLQCLLYSSPSECRRITAKIRDGGFDAVYLDSVRCQTLLRILRRALPGIAVVADFGDLMSRRLEHLASRRLPLLTGHVCETVPVWLRRLIEGPMARVVTRYEARTLHHAEEEVACLSNTVILVSATEAAMLQARLVPALRGRVQAILPPMDLRKLPWTEAKSFRFIFIGSDRLLQNRLAIDHLVELWRREHPGPGLHVYGEQMRPAPDVAGVVWHGFVEDLSEAYQPGSIMLYPGLLPGGIKTKIAEVWSYGCAVLGNDAAFDGLPVGPYPLNLPQALWGPLLAAPQSQTALWAQAAAVGHRFVGHHLSPALFHQTWTRVVANLADQSPQLMVPRRAGETDSIAVPSR